MKGLFISSFGFPRKAIIVMLLFLLHFYMDFMLLGIWAILYCSIQYSKVWIAAMGYSIFGNILITHFTHKWAFFCDCPFVTTVKMSFPLVERKKACRMVILVNTMASILIKMFGSLSVKKSAKNQQSLRRFENPGL